MSKQTGKKPRSSQARTPLQAQPLALHPEDSLDPSTQSTEISIPGSSQTPEIQLPKKKCGHRLAKDSIEIHTTDGRWYQDWDFRDHEATKAQAARSMKQLGNNIAGLTRALGVANSTLVAKDVLITDLKKHISDQQNKIIRLNAEMKENHPAKDWEEKANKIGDELSNTKQRHSLELKTKQEQHERTANYLTGRIEEEKKIAESWKDGYYKYKNRSQNVDLELESLRTKFEHLSTSKKSHFEEVKQLRGDVSQKDDQIEELVRRNQLLEKTIQTKNTRIEFLFDEQFKYKERLNKVYDREKKLDERRYGKKRYKSDARDSAVMLEDE